MTEEARIANQTSAKRRADYLVNLLWHAGSFAIIGGLFMFFDWRIAGDLGWSIWVVGAWAVALAFHALAYLIDGSNLRNRKVRQYLYQMERGGDGDHKIG